MDRPVFLILILSLNLNLILNLIKKTRTRIRLRKIVKTYPEVLLFGRSCLSPRH